MIDERLLLDRVYQKTEAGGAEIRHREILRDVQRRSLLLLINGVRPLRELLQTLRLSEADAQRYIGELLDLGLIAPAARFDLPSAPRASVPSATEVPLPEIERIFAHYIGPLAPLLLRKHLGQAQDRTDLIRRLAAHLNDQEQRQAFVEAVARLR